MHMYLFKYPPIHEWVRKHGINARWGFIQPRRTGRHRCLLGNGSSRRSVYKGRKSRFRETNIKCFLSVVDPKFWIET